MRLVECVPNFSEGQNQKVIDAIAETIAQVEGVSLLDVDPGKSTNRTVVTFVGEPDAACEAAFQAIAKAGALIDMRKHQGEHPRMGATDVCPFVPVSGTTMDDCVGLAKKLGKRVGEELGIPVYLYGEAADSEERRNLADVRSGEYEGLAERMANSFKPDFGPGQFNAQSGATIIGARQFLIAYNVNLNTTSQKLAQEIALNIREAGRTKKDDKGQVVRDENGAPVKIPGTLKECKAVGWYIPEFNQAQVSINLTNFTVTSLHTVFDEVCRQAEALGLRVTGSEIVGLVPLEPLLEAGRHYLIKQGQCTGVSDSTLVNIASKSLGLSDLEPFDPKSKIIEYRVAEGGGAKLKDLSLAQFVDEVASDSPAPGGGSVSALCGSLSASLSAMVGNLTFSKKGFEEAQELMNELSNSAQKLKGEFLEAVDADTLAFKQIIEARRLPKASEEDKRKRDQAIASANKNATLVPLAVLEKALSAFAIAERMAANGNPNSASDAGVALAASVCAAEGAYYNVLINLAGIEDPQFSQSVKANAEDFISRIRKQWDDSRARLVNKL